MTAEEEQAKLQAFQRRVAEQIHDLLNLMAILKGETDILIDSARERLAAFYEKYPELR